jgi:hypothetical protein
MSDYPTAVPARAATDEEIEGDRAWAIQADSDLKDAIVSVRRNLWDVAKALHEWDLRRGWLKTGNYETLGEWLADPQVAMTKATYHGLLSGYRTLVLERNVPEQTVRELDTSKVGVVLRAIRDHEVKVEDAISDVESLSKSDLIEKYRPAPSGDAPESHRWDNGAGDGTGVFDEDVLAEHEPVDTDEDEYGEPDVIEVEAVDLTELEPLEWAVEALQAISSPLDKEPWATAYTDAGEGEDGLRAIALVALEGLEDEGDGDADAA